MVPFLCESVLTSCEKLFCEKLFCSSCSLNKCVVIAIFWPSCVTAGCYWSVLFLKFFLVRSRHSFLFVFMCFSFCHSSSKLSCWSSRGSISWGIIRHRWRLLACPSRSLDTAPCPEHSRPQPQPPSQLWCRSRRSNRVSPLVSSSVPCILTLPFTGHILIQRCLFCCDLVWPKSTLNANTNYCLSADISTVPLKLLDFWAWWTQCCANRIKNTAEDDAGDAVFNILARLCSLKIAIVW